MSTSAASWLFFIQASYGSGTYLPKAVFITNQLTNGQGRKLDVFLGIIEQFWSHPRSTAEEILGAEKYSPRLALSDHRCANADSA
jgi:hypothetical protein